MKYNKVNTFSREPSLPQIGAYIAIITQTCIFYIMVAPSYSSESSKIAFITIYTIVTSLLVIFATISSCIDPSDSIMVQYLTNNQNFRNQSQDLLYCQFCKSFVQKGSRHCRKCDRCVENFDHHCVWINNCIGSRNYKFFFIMIVLAALDIVVFITSVIVLATEELWQSNYLGYMITAFIVLGIMTIFFLMDFNLILLHIYLCCKGYTTYDFIVKRRQDERLQEQKKMREQNDRKVQDMKIAVQRQRQQLKKKYESLKKQGQNSKKILSQDQYSEQKIIEVKANNQNLTPQLNAAEGLSQFSETIKKSASYQNSNSRKDIFEQNQSKFNNISVDSSQLSKQQFRYKQQAIRRNIDQQQSSRLNQVRISKFFIRSKSLKFLINEQEAISPSFKGLNCTDYGRNVDINSATCSPLKKRNGNKQDIMQIKNLPNLKSVLASKDKLQKIVSAGQKVSEEKITKDGYLFSKGKQKK